MRGLAPLYIPSSIPVWEGDQQNLRPQLHECYLDNPRFTQQNQLHLPVQANQLSQLFNGEHT